MKRVIITLLFASSLYSQRPINGGAGGGSGSGGSGVTNVATGCGVTGGPITATGTISGTGPCLGSGGGTAQAQTATYSPVNASLTNGLWLCWTPTNANTGGGPTFAPDGLTAHTIVKAGGVALAANDIIPTAKACAVYDTTGTQWELQNPQTAGGGSTQCLQTVTYSATPTFDFSLCPAQMITLSGNISPAVTNLSSCKGVVCSILFVQGSVAAYSITWPLNVLGGMQLGGQLGKRNSEAFISDGTNLIGTGAFINQ